MKRGGRKVIAWGLGLFVLLVMGGWALLRLGNDTGTEDFQHETFLPRGQASGEIDAVAQELVDRWLRHFTTSSVGWATRLRDYRIDRVDVMRTGDRLIVSATMQVKPARWSFENWLAGSGGTVENGWIRGKYTRFDLTETQEGYRLRQIGPGPV